jgi:tetratricopeptide (TPR) repeat protein
MDNTVDLIKTLSGIQQKTGDTLPAIETLKEIFAIDALNVETYRQIIAIQKEIGLANECVETYIALSDVLNNTGNLEEGMRILEEAIALKPEDIPLRRKSFNVHLQSGNVARAIEDLFFICDLLAKEERYQEILNILAEILEIEPGNLQARKRRAETYALMGDEKKALAEFLKLSSDIDTGKIAMTGGEFHARSALQKSPWSNSP